LNEYHSSKKNSVIKAKIEVRSINVKNPDHPKTKVPLSNIEIAEEKVSKTLEMIYKKNERNFFVSKKRSVFTEWRKYILFQRGFLHAIANFAYKGMEHKGFQAIKHASIENHRLEVLKRVLEKYFLTKFLKKYIKSAFNNWKMHEFVSI